MRKKLLVCLILVAAVFAAGCVTNPIKEAGIDVSKLPDTGQVSRKFSFEKSNIATEKPFSIGILPVKGNPDAVFAGGSGVVSAENKSRALIGAANTMPIVYMLAANKKTSDVIFYYFPVNQSYIRSVGGQCIREGLNSSSYQVGAAGKGIGNIIAGANECADLLPVLQKAGEFPVAYGTLRFYKSQWFKINKPVNWNNEEEIAGMIESFLDNAIIAADFSVTTASNSIFTKIPEWEYASVLVNSNVSRFEDAVRAVTYLGLPEIQDKIKKHYEPINLDSVGDYRICVYESGCKDIAMSGRYGGFALGSCSLKSNVTLREAIKEVNKVAAKNKKTKSKRPADSCDATNSYSFFLIDDAAYRLTPPFKAGPAKVAGVINTVIDERYINIARVLYTVTESYLSGANCVVVRGNLTIKGMDKDELRELNAQLGREKICE